MTIHLKRRKMLWTNQLFLSGKLESYGQLPMHDVFSHPASLQEKIENNMASCKVSLKPMVGFKIFQKYRHWCSLCYFSRLLSGWTLPIRCLCRQHQLCWGTGSGTGRVCIDTTPLGSRGNSWAAAKMEQLPPFTAGHFQSNARWLRWSAQLRLRFTVHLSRIFKGEMRSRWTLCVVVLRSVLWLTQLDRLKKRRAWELV